MLAVERFESGEEGCARRLGGGIEQHGAAGLRKHERLRRGRGIPHDVFGDQRSARSTGQGGRVHHGVLLGLTVGVGDDDAAPVAPVLENAEVRTGRADEADFIAGADVVVEHVPHAYERQRVAIPIPQAGARAAVVPKAHAVLFVTGVEEDGFLLPGHCHLGHGTGVRVGALRGGEVRAGDGFVHRGVGESPAFVEPDLDVLATRLVEVLPHAADALRVGQPARVVVVPRDDIHVFEAVLDAEQRGVQGAGDAIGVVDHDLRFRVGLLDEARGSDGEPRVFRLVLLPLVELRLVLDFENHRLAAEVPHGGPHVLVPRSFDAGILPTWIVGGPLHVERERLAAVLFVHQPRRPAVEHDVLREAMRLRGGERVVVPVERRARLLLEIVPLGFGIPARPAETDALQLLDHLRPARKRATEALTGVGLRRGFGIWQRGQREVRLVEQRAVFIEHAEPRQNHAGMRELERSGFGNGLPRAERDPLLHRRAERLLAFVIHQLPAHRNLACRAAGIRDMCRHCRRRALLEQIPRRARIAGQVRAFRDDLGRAARHVVRRALAPFGNRHAINQDGLVAAADLQQVVRLRPEPVLRHIGRPGERHALPFRGDVRALLALAHPQTLRLGPDLARARRHLHGHLARLLAPHPQRHREVPPALRHKRCAHHIALRDAQRVIAHLAVFHQRLLRRCDLMPVKRPALERTVAQEVLRLGGGQGGAGR